MPDSFNEFLLDYAINFEHHLNSTAPNKRLRAGQVFFNLLAERRPDVADSIRGSEFDPFYHEDVSDETMQKVELLW
jgi:hypothetical protein